MRAALWRELESTVLSDMNQTQKAVCLSLFVCPQQENLQRQKVDSWQTVDLWQKVDSRGTRVEGGGVGSDS